MRRTVPTLFAYAILALTAPLTPARADHPSPYAGTFDLVLTQSTPQPNRDVLIQGLLQNGQATFLGPFQGDVQYLVHPDGSFKGTARKVAANGDVLRESLTGSLTPLGSSLTSSLPLLGSIGTFKLTGGTGQFANATGGGAFLSTFTGAATAAVQFTGSASSDASAGRDPLLKPLSFHVSGDGVFNPANIGTPQGGNAGHYFGDGSGLAPYTASGTDFVLDGFDLGRLGLGRNDHVGAAQSTTEGTLVGKATIAWPAVVARNPDPPKHGDPRVHVTHTDLGDLYFTYTGRFLLDLGTGVITGQAGFVVTGGTGLFEEATGYVYVNVVSTGNDPAGGVDFHYEFDGFIILDE
jgi:hypothetical protein